MEVTIKASIFDKEVIKLCPYGNYAVGLITNNGDEFILDENTLKRGLVVLEENRKLRDGYFRKKEIK